MVEFENKYNILRSIKSDKLLAPKFCYYIQKWNKKHRNICDTGDPDNQFMTEARGT